MSTRPDRATSTEVIEPSPRNDKVSSGPDATAPPRPLEALSIVEPPPPSAPPRHLKLKLLSCGFSFFVAGVNDGSLGTLIPYMLEAYGISSSLIAILYIASFTGWLFCAASNGHLSQHFATGTLLGSGATLQLAAHALRAWQPPFGLFAASFFVAALGAAYQDSHANAIVSGDAVGGAAAHRWLGFIHAMYGLGCLVAPLVASPVAGATRPSRWYLFYLFPLALSVVNVALVGLAFREGWGRQRRKSPVGDGEVVQGSGGRNAAAVMELKQMLKLRNLWLLSLFFFFHLGAATTTGGWVVSYLIQTRHDPISTAGYVPTGFYGGLFLGRLLLAEPTRRLGERRMLALYALCCLALQLVFWLVPDLVASVVTFALMGFFLGPFFAAGISVGSKILPSEIQPTALGFIFVLAQAGGSLFPSITGLIATRAGVQVLQPVAVGLIAVMGVSWVLVPKVD